MTGIGATIGRTDRAPVHFFLARWSRAPGKPHGARMAQSAELGFALSSFNHYPLSTNHYPLPTGPPLSVADYTLLITVVN